MLFVNMNQVRGNPQPIDVIQNEDQDFLLVVDPSKDPFELPITNIHIDFVDQKTPNPTIITINTITRLLEDTKLLVLKFQLNAADSDTLMPGMISVGIFIDQKKGQLLQAFRCIAKLH